MRLSYLDILEQCFHDKFRGYNKQEVDTFLHLIADDFKSMAEEIKEKDLLIKKLRDSNNKSESGDNPLSQITPEMLKEKAKKIIKLFTFQCKNSQNTIQNSTEWNFTRYIVGFVTFLVQIVALAVCAS